MNEESSKKSNEVTLDGFPQSWEECFPNQPILFHFPALLILKETEGLRRLLHTQKKWDRHVCLAKYPFNHVFSTVFWPAFRPQDFSLLNQLSWVAVTDLISERATKPTLVCYVSKCLHSPDVGKYCENTQKIKAENTPFSTGYSVPKQAKFSLPLEVCKQE